MKMTKVLTGLTAACAAMVSTQAFAANTLEFTINNPIQAISQSGGTLSFSGTLIAPATNSGDEYVNGLFSSSSLYIDVSPILNILPLVLSPGQSYIGALFDAIVPPTNGGRTFAGEFGLAGGASSSSSDPLGTQNFTIVVLPSGVVSPSSPAVPEPAAWMMMILGMGVVGYTMRRRKVTTRVQFA